jgi:hypothetical protein
MAETKEITRLYVVTDSETHYDNIGDIDGGLFDDEWLEQHIKSHGTEQLIEKLASMQMQVLSMKYKTLREISDKDGVCFSTPKNTHHVELCAGAPACSAAVGLHHLTAKVVAGGSSSSRAGARGWSW